MRDITRIDIRKVTPYGRYIDLDKPLIFDLTNEEIIALRKYHNKPDIAYEKAIVRRTVPQNQNVKRNYKVTRDQKYNKGKHRTKRKIKRHYGKRIIVGGLLIIVLFGSRFIKAGGPNAAAGYFADDVYGPSYTDYAEYIDNDNEEFVAYEDAVAYEDVVDETHEIDDELNEVSNEEDVVTEDVVTEANDERQDLIRNICNIYQLDYDKVYNNLVNITDNFTNSEYLEGRIAGVTCKGANVQASTEEELLVYAIRCMKQLPGQMGINSSGIYNRNGYVSGDNYYEQINRVANVLGLDRCLMYAVVNAECSFNSPLFLGSNNPAGLKGTDGNWWVFDTKEEGFFELGMELLKYYRKIGVSPDNIDSGTLSRIRDIHAPLSDGNGDWLPNVLDGLGYAKMHEAEMFGSYEQTNGLSF